MNSFFFASQNFFVTPVAHTRSALGRWSLSFACCRVLGSPSRRCVCWFSSSHICRTVFTECLFLWVFFYRILTHAFTQETSRERRDALYFTKHSVNEGWVLSFLFQAADLRWQQESQLLRTFCLELAGMHGCWHFFLKTCSQPGQDGTILKRRR